MGKEDENLPASEEFANMMGARATIFLEQGFVGIVKQFKVQGYP